MHCNLAAPINHHAYIQASLHGPKGEGDYTKWAAIISNPTQQGLNQIEAQLVCLLLGKVSARNLIQHLVRNVTGVQVIGMHTNAQSLPSTLSTPTPPMPPTEQGPQSIIPSIPQK
jgi:hypothetical protein